jgi:prepilin peptidase CpaA
MFESLQIWGVGLTGLAACATDLRHRRIPNVLTMGSTIVALALRVGIEGGWAMGAGAAGWAVGVLLLAPLFAARGLGGGDVKLLGAFGAWLGPTLVLWAAAYGAIAGGVLALVVALWAGYLRRALANLRLVLTTWRVGGIRAVAGVTLEDTKGPRLAYAIPLTCGLLVTLWFER